MEAEARVFAKQSDSYGGAGTTAPDLPTVATQDGALADETLVEEISVDGMCGVY